MRGWHSADESEMLTRMAGGTAAGKLSAEMIQRPGESAAMRTASKMSQSSLLQGKLMATGGRQGESLYAASNLLVSCRCISRFAFWSLRAQSRRASQ